MLMCPAHWGQTPVALRVDIIRHYRHGQCDDKRPSREWAKAARAALTYVEDLP